MATIYLEELDKLKENLVVAKEKYEDHRKSCTHDIQKNTSSGTATAVCVLCEKDFGPWCQESEDHICHYDDEIIPMYGHVKLNNNTEVGIDISKMRLVSGRTKCIYCGKPKERK